MHNRKVKMKLFCGGLAWATDDDSLRAAFEEFGTVTEAKVIQDRQTGRSRGFGFVTFENNEEGQAAIEKMDGARLDGRNIRVNEAQDRPQRSGGGGGGGRGGGGYGGDRGGSYGSGGGGGRGGGGYGGDRGGRGGGGGGRGGGGGGGWGGGGGGDW
jgi:cold-inducible RNA-binding protein